MGQHRRSDHAGAGATKKAVPVADAVRGAGGVRGELRFAPDFDCPIFTAAN